MAIITGSFEWKDAKNTAKVTVQKPSGLSRMRVWRLQTILPANPPGITRHDAATMCYYLGNTVSVEGSLGFAVPLETPTPEELVRFCLNLGDADENLLIKWDNTIEGLTAATNDPDLLPPEELSQKKEKTPA